MNYPLSLVLSAGLSALLLAGCGDAKKSDAPAAPKPAPAENKDAPAKPADKKDEPKGEEKKAEAPPAPASDSKGADDSVTITFGKDEPKRSMVVPKSWKQEEPSSGMRLLQFRAPKQKNDTEDADMAIFKMAGGGGADANIGRWVSQFGGGDALKKKRTLKTASGDEAIIAELEGTYTAMTAAGTGEPKSGYMMLGAIIVTDKGEYYFKFAGPHDTIDANKAAFDKMIESFK